MKSLLISLSLLIAMAPTFAQRKAADNKPLAAPTKTEEPATLALLGGPAPVEVNVKPDMTLPVGLATSGVVIVESKAQDPLKAIHPSSTIKVEAKRESFVFRPATGYVAATPNATPTPSASALLEFQSGLKIVLLFYPVTDLSKSATRIVLRYDVTTICLARQASEPGFDPKTCFPKPQPVQDEKQEEPKRPAVQPTIVSPDVIYALADLDTAPARTNCADSKCQLQATQEELGKAFNHKTLRWTSSSNTNLAVGVSAPRVRANGNWSVVIAVKNAGDQPLAIKEPSVLVYRPNVNEALPTKLLAVVVPDSEIPVGGVGYYSVEFQPRVLQVGERLMVSVPRITAAEATLMANKGR